MRRIDSQRHSHYTPARWRHGTTPNFPKLPKTSHFFDCEPHLWLYFELWGVGLPTIGFAEHPTQDVQRTETGLGIAVVYSSSDFAWKRFGNSPLRKVLGKEDRERKIRDRQARLQPPSLHLPFRHFPFHIFVRPFFVEESILADPAILAVGCLVTSGTFPRCAPPSRKSSAGAHRRPPP